MSTENEALWGAMKNVHYRRTIEQLERGIRNTRRIEEALTVALDMVVNAVHAVAGTFWFYDQFGGGRILPKAVYGGADLKGISLLPGEGIAGQVIQNGKPLIIAECQKDPRWAGKTDEKTGFRTETMICVPLILNTAVTGDEVDEEEAAEAAKRGEEIVFGCIQLINRTDNVAFDEKDMHFAEDLARSTGKLFRKQGLLDGYLSDAGVGPKGPEAITFMHIFGAPDDREMEKRIRQLPEFAQLRVSDQEGALKLCRELRQYFKRSAGRGRFGGFFR